MSFVPKFQFHKTVDGEGDLINHHNVGLFVQWKCDVHDQCDKNKNDIGYCPEGCTFASLNRKSLLRYRTNDEGGTCTCEDEPCRHQIKPEDFHKLKV